MAAVLPLPLVPAIWMNFSFFWGLPIISSICCILCSPGTEPLR